MPNEVPWNDVFDVRNLRRQLGPSLGVVRELKIEQHFPIPVQNRELVFFHRPVKAAEVGK